MIANYEKDRSELEEGQPCPLCFSTSHPFRGQEMKPFVDQAKVELEIQLLRLEANGDTSLQFIDKYNLLSPAVTDTSLESRTAFPDLKRNLSSRL